MRQQLQARFGQFATTTLDSSTVSELATDTDALDVSMEDEFLRQIRELVESDLSNSNFGMEQLMSGLKMSRTQIYKKVKVLTGKSPSVFTRTIRLYHGKQLIESSKLNISEVAYDVGFSSPAYFSKLFLEEFGQTPSQIRK